jgi:hypothetical protein
MCLPVEAKKLYPTLVGREVEGLWRFACFGPARLCGSPLAGACRGCSIEGDEACLRPSCRLNRWLPASAHSGSRVGGKCSLWQQIGAHSGQFS